MALSKHLEISQINDLIYLGSFEHLFDSNEEFTKLNIDVIINCAKEIVHTEETKDKFIVENFPFEDDNHATLLEYIDEINDKIHDFLSSNKKIYIHGAYGISRAPAILIYYLMSYKQFSYDEAFALIKAIRPIIDINDNFERELRAIEEY